jgi:hypothetical protein
MNMQTNETTVESTRIRMNTPVVQNQTIDDITRNNIEKYANSPDDVITHHLHELDREWDIERTLEVNLATVASTGLLFSIVFNRRWLILPAVALGFFVQHAIQGWCPPLSLFRALKFRSRSEIEQEKYGLKALRGDFIGIDTAEDALKAVQRY